ncbi:MAG: glycosyltransferase family 2 protein [Thermosynechococcaceae cyanobacterium MS004]|nr:glycosyltransferase family 2 protein [Thermosynechococcaceae cyanobacterium MS004]
MRPLVSILIPCYNAAPWLAQTLESALAQTWTPTEIIVVDDGSTDGSVAIAQSFAPRGVTVIAQSNRGASATRNTAFNASKGEFIQFLDADDLLSPNKIADQVQLLQQSPLHCMAICSTMHFFDGDDPAGGIFHEGLPFFADSDDPVAWLTRLFGGDGEGAMVHPGAWLMPRAIAEQIGPWNEALTVDDDGEYFARAILSSAGIRRSPTAVSYYRKHRSGVSLSGARSERHQRSALLALDLKTQHLLAHTQDPRAKRALARCFLEYAVAAYPAHRSLAAAALKQVKALGGSDYHPPLGGQGLQWIGRIFGWKVARRISVQAQRWKTRGRSAAFSLPSQSVSS